MDALHRQTEPLLSLDIDFLEHALTKAGPDAGPGAAVKYMLGTHILIYVIKNKPPAVAERSTQKRATGTPIGVNKLWIACHALVDGCTLVNNNTREFERVAGLRLENWASDAVLP